MKKNQIQPKTALGAVVVNLPASEISNNEATQGEKAQGNEEKQPTEELKPTPEQLAEENERLKKLLASQPQTLAEKIEFFKKKQDLVKQLTKLDSKRESIYEAFVLCTEAMEKDEFFSENFTLQVNYKTSMHSREEEIFKFSNPVIIGELMQFVIDRLDSKREEVKFLIEA